MESRNSLEDYAYCITLDMMLAGYETKYPFKLNEQAVYTQHQIEIYKDNYCHSETEPSSEQPSITGGGKEEVYVVLADL